MKLNLPSTITNQKDLFFYFWTLANLGKSKSGKTFKNCLDSSRSQGNYTDLVTKIANNISSPNNGTFCCDNNFFSNNNITCSPLINDRNYNFTNYCPNSLLYTIFGRCIKIDQSYFCVTYDYLFYIPSGFDLGNEILCGGRLDNNLITTNITSNECIGLSVSNLTQFLTPISLNFTAICCANSNVFYSDYCTPGDLGLAKYGGVFSTIVNCFGDFTYTLMCFQDNGGWTCTGSGTNQINLYPLGYIANGTYPSNNSIILPTSFSNITYIGDCNIQIKLPAISSTISPSNLPQNNSSNNPNLTIIIPTTIGSIGAISIGGITYYFIRKEKKKIQSKQKRNQELELVNLNETEPAEINQAVNASGIEIHPSEPQQLTRRRASSTHSLSYFQQELIKKEQQIVELERIRKYLKEKVIDAYVYFVPKEQKELLRQLIITKIELSTLVMSEKNDETISKCKQQFYQFRSQLFNKLNSEEKDNEVERILADCGELVAKELELERTLNDKHSFIENQKQNNNDSEQSKIIELAEKTQQEQEKYKLERQKSLLIAKQQGKLESKDEEIIRMNQTISQTISDSRSQQINNTQVGNVNFNNTEIVGKVTIGAGQVNLNTQIEEITNQQAQIQLPPKS